MNRSVLRWIISSVFSCVMMMVGVRVGAAAAPSTGLHVDVFVGDSESWGVTSTLIYGKSEALVIDSQLRVSQAKKLADEISLKGVHLKAIIISHPDEDHYFGTAILHERFPDAPIYMTAAALEQFKAKSDKYLAYFKKKSPTETPDSLPAVEALPTTILSVDGETVDVIKDFQGDVLKPTNSFFWIPSLRTVIAGDIVFNGVHAFLGDSSPESRQAWHHSLQLIAALRPKIVVAGHKKNASLGDSSQDLVAMEKYLDDFDSARTKATNADQIVASMKQKYPNFIGEDLLVFSAEIAFPPAMTK